jgi:hypothetical protein
LADAIIDQFVHNALRIFLQGESQRKIRAQRTIYYLDIYIKDYASVMVFQKGLEDYLWLNNCEKPHNGLGFRTPAEGYSMSGKSAGIPLETHINNIESWSWK